MQTYWGETEPALLSLCPSLRQHHLTLRVPWIPILGLAGMELVFFIAAPVVLCFGFVTKEMLIKYQCFSYCWIQLVTASKSCLFFTLPPGNRAGLGVGRMLGEDAARTAEPPWPKGYSSSHVMLSNKTFQSTHCSWTGTGLPVGCGVWLLCTTCFFPPLFILPY